MTPEELDALSPAEHTDYICQLQAVDNAIKRKRRAAIESYDRMEKWKADGVTSMASWQVGMLGHGRETAIEEVRVSHAFEQLPHIAENFDDDLLSWDQARAVTVFATPETDEHLAGEARKFSAQQLRRMARRHKPVTQQEAKGSIDARCLKIWWESSRSLMHFKGTLPAAEGAKLEKAVYRVYRQIAERNTHSGEAEYNADQLRADALVELASARIAQDADPDRATIAVHVDARVLAGEEGMAELDCGHAIAMETARRLACDSRWYIVIDGPGGLPLGIGRTSRQVPPWLAREIRHRDGGCRWFGCGRQGFCDIHHLISWGEGGPSDTNNLLMLCSVHHRLVHEGGWKIIGDPNGELTFVAPTGVVYSQGPPALREDLKERVAALTGEKLRNVGPAP